MHSSEIIQQVTFAVSIPNVRGTIDKLVIPRVGSHELLGPSVTGRKKLMDASFVSILCSVCKL